MTEETNFEILLKEKFTDFAETPSEIVWEGVRRKLSFYEFFHFNYNSFNIYYVAAIIATLTAGIILFTKNDEPPAKLNEIKQIESLKIYPLVPENVPVEQPGIVPLNEQKTLLPPDTIKISSVEKKTSGYEKAEVPLPYKPEETAKADSIVVEKTVLVHTLGKLPLASFSMSENSSCGMLVVEFQNTSENAVSYTWDFGDGVISNQRNPVYLFNNPGQWIVQLKAKDLNGNISVAFDTVSIKGISKN